MNVVTNKPESTFSASAEALYGSFDTFAGEAMVNLPLSDKVAVRIAGQASTSDGYVKNLTTGNRLNGGDSFAVRASTRLTPGTDTTIDFIAAWHTSGGRTLQGEKQLCARDPIGNLGCLPDALGFDYPNHLATLDGLYSYADLDPFTPGTQALYDSGVDPYLTAVKPRNRRQVALDFDPKAEADDLVLSLEIGHRFDALTLASVTGYAEHEGSYSVDSDFATPTLGFNPVPGFFDDGLVPVSAADPGNLGSLAGRLTGFSATPFGLSRGESKERQWIQEVRLASDFSGPVNFLVGAFYLDFDNDQDLYNIATSLDAFALANQSVVDFLGVDASFAPPFFRLETDRNDLTSYAVFGEVYADLTETLTLTSGARWTRDEKHQSNRSLLFAESPFDKNSANFEAWTGRVGLDWSPDTTFADDLLLYGFYSRGYKGGGFNPKGAAVNLPSTFEPEHVNAFEMGAKSTIGGTVVANLTGFYYNYDGLQVSKIVNRTSINENIDASITGAEIELLWSPARGLAFDTSLGFLHSSIDGAESIDPRDPTGGDPNLIAVKDINGAANCVATIEELFVLLGGEPFGDCATLALSSGAPVSLDGNSLQNAPRWTIAFGAQYTHQVGSGYDLTVRADYSYRSDSWARIFNRNPIDRIDGWSIVNINAELASEDTGWYARAGIRNLFDEDAITGHYLSDATGGLATSVFYLPPRNVSLTLGRQF